MRATPLHLIVASILGLGTSCAPESKNGDTTKDSGQKSTDSTVTDLNTDELTSGDIQQVSEQFTSTSGVGVYWHFNEWWLGDTYNRVFNINDNAQPGDTLLYFDLDGYTPSVGTWTVEDVEAGGTHPLFEVLESDSAFPRLSIRELDATSGNIGDSSLTSLSQGDESYSAFIRQAGGSTVYAYCKTIASGSIITNRICGDCISVDGTAYSDALGYPQSPNNRVCDDSEQYFGAKVTYNDGTNSFDDVIWWQVDDLQAPTITDFDNLNDGSTGGIVYDNIDEGTAIGLESYTGTVNVDYTEDASQGLPFDDDPDETTSIRARLYGCTTSDMLYVTEGIEWRITNTDSRLKFGNIDEIRLSYSPSLTTASVWNSSNNTVNTYPAFGSVNTDDLGDYCQIDYRFRNGGDITVSSSSSDIDGKHFISALLGSFTYRYSDAGADIGNEGLRTLQVVLRGEDDQANPDYAMASQPAEIDIAVYNNPALTDATTATVFDGTPDVIVNVDYDATLTVGGTDLDGDPCYATPTTVVAGQDTTITFSKTNGDDLSEGTHTCTLTPVRTVTPTRVTDGESTSFDFTGSVETFSLLVDTTAPTISITQIADGNGYTTSVTPTFDVTTDEDGTLVLGGSCTTSTSTSLLSGTTTITLDTLTEGQTYSDCTVRVDDAAGNQSTTENLNAFTPDATAPTVTIDTEVADGNGYTTTTDPTFEVTSDEAGTLSVGGSCSITGQASIAASTSTTITLDTVTDGSTYADCTVTVTDIAGNQGTASLASFTVDVTTPTISITQIADGNGYTTSVTPTFDVTTDEDGTLVLGGSCTTSTSTSLLSGTTTITLDTLTEGQTYSDCTVRVDDAAGNQSTTENLNAFTPDVTAPSITATLVSPLSGSSTITEDTTPDVTIVLPVAESNTTIAVDAAETECSLSSGSLTGGGASNVITLTHPSTTDYTDSTVACDVDLVDMAGNTADATITFSVDTAAPTISVATQPTTPTNAPVFALDTDEDGTMSLLGDCSSGSPEITGSSAIADTSSGAAAQVTIAGLTEATYYTCQIVVTDAAGRSSSAPLDTFVVDTTSDAPVLTGISNDNGLSSTDLIVSDAAVGFVGTAEAGAEVTVTIDDGTTTVDCVVTADGNGDWTCDQTTDTGGAYSADLGSADTSTDYTVTAVAVDALTNATSSTSNSLTVTVDLEVPTLSVAVIGVTASSNPTVTLTSDQAVNSTFEIGGEADDDCALASYTEVADASSGNTFTLVHETTGGFPDGSTYNCSATVTDVAGNTSSITNFDFTVTQTPGTVVISQSAPVDSSAGSGSVTSNTTPTVSIYSNTAIDVTGSISLTGGCETAATTLTVDDNTTLTLTATGGAAFTDGVYSCILTVNDGTNSSNALTLDSFTIDSTAPTITVTDTNANVTTSISVSQDTTIGTTVATVSGTDTYASTITYTEDPAGDAVANAALQIDSSTGVVSLTTPLTLGTTYTYAVLVTDDALPTNNESTETITFTVTEANIAPSLDENLVADFSNISEHIIEGDNLGQLVSTLLTDGSNPAIVDGNTTSAQGIAIYNTSAEAGSEWQYKDATGNWVTVPSVSGTSAFLLTSDDMLRLVPSVTNGETGSISFYAWDQTDGTQYGTESVTTRGGSTPYSTADASVSITVVDANDPPTMTASTIVTLTAIDEGDTSTFILNSQVSSLISDVDTATAFNTLGVAVTSAVETESGSWQYSTDAGTTWSNFSDLAFAVSDTTALLLDASDSNGRIRFVSNTSNGETATLSFHAWDQSTGTAGDQVDITAVYADVDSTYSASGSANTFSLLVNDLNDAPVLASTVADFSPINEDDTTNSGSLVSTLLNGALSDVDTTSSQGIAIYSVASGNGTWEYSADATTWNPFPSVSSSGALVLVSTDSVRFVPNNANADSASITYYGWDQSDASSSGDTVDVSSVGGETAFSTASETSSITVNDINDQPVLDITTSPITLTTINEGDSDAISYSASTLISTTIGSTISDSDVSPSKGIAITDASSTNGYWEYSVDSETTWMQISSVSTTSALLLDESAYLRFASTGPDGVTATLTFYAWDQTDGNSSEDTADTTAVFTPSTISPFSVDSNSLSLDVTDLNDAPVLVGQTTTLTAISEDDANNAESDVTTFELATLIADNALITDTDTTPLFSNTGIAVTGVSNTNGRWDYSIDSETTWTEITGVSSTNVLVLDESAFIRFIPDSTNGTTATLTFLAWDGSDSASNGTSVSITGANQGNDQAYSVNEDTLSLLVTDVNDQPAFSNTSAVVLTPEISEGDTSTAFNLFTVIDPTTTVTDVDDPTLTNIGVALVSASTTEGEWEYSEDSGTTWTSVPSVSNSDALLLEMSTVGTSALVRFNATAGENGTTATLQVYAWDKTQTPDPADVSTQNTTDGVASPFSSATRDLTLVVNPVNDQPVLDTTTSPITLTTINEGDSDAISYSASTLISTTIGSTITETDTTDSKGIAITDASSVNGYWEYSVDSETTWTQISSVSTTSALLLDESAYLRFASTGPDGVTATLTFYAWDQTDGNSSEDTADTTAVFTPSTTSPFSVDSNSLSLDVTDLNDAPELTAGVSIDLGTITEDDAPAAAAPTYSGLNTFQVSAVVTNSIYTDTDTTPAFNNKGIVLTAVSTTNGRWEYSKDAEATWTTVPAVSTSLVLPLDAADYIRFVPNGQNGTTATMRFLAWDQSNSPTLAIDNTTSLSAAEQGDDGAYSLNANEFSLTVTSINDAPVLSTSGTTTLTAITEDNLDNGGQLVSSIVGSRVSDVDAGAVYGLAVTALSSGVGTWEFNLNDGSGWQAIEGGSSITTSNARLIPSNAGVRFNPNVAAANGEVTDPTMTYVLWDQSTGSSGGLTSAVTTGTTTAYSVASETASITVSDVNDAPVITSATNFTGITEDENQGATPSSFSQISALVTVTDVDNSAPNEGIAIVAQSATNGVWKYSTDGSTWGTVSLVSGALVLDLDDFLAFIPDGANGGTSTLEFHAWDQYSDTTAPTPGTNTTVDATGGPEPFSAATDTLSIVVSDVNDAPVWPLGTSGGSFTAITEDDLNNSGNFVVDLLNSTDSDDDTGANRGIAVFARSLGSNGTGSWEYSTDTCVTWQSIGSVSTSSALLLRNTDCLRFVPDGENGEATNPSVDFYVWDGNPSLFGTTADASIRGGTDSTATFSENSARSEIVVSDVNDAPVITAFGMVYNEGEITVQLNTTDVIGNNADVVLEDIDIGASLTVTLTLAATNWPFDTSAPSGGARTFVVNNQFVTLDVTDVYGGTLNTNTSSWDDATNSLTLTGTVASLNAELQTLTFTPTAGLTPTDSATVGVPDFDFDTTITMTVDDTVTSVSEAIALTTQNTEDDKPIAIGYWEAYEDATAAANEDQSKLVTELQPTSPADGVYVRINADLSWDPDDQDGIVSYTFTPSEPIAADCGGTIAFYNSTTGCTLTDGTDFITHPARASALTWTISVTDNGGQSNSVADDHDQVTVSIANQPPEVAVFLASEVSECTRAHGTAENNPVYADEDLDCFCDQTACNLGSATCVDNAGVDCNPTLSATFTECSPLAAVYGDDNRGTETGCYCEEMDCDGTNDDGEANCFDINGLACVPSTNNIDACVPTVSPNDFDFPYDVTLELIACTYDINADPLTFTWSLSTPPSAGTANLTTVDNRAFLSIDPPVSNGVASYFLDDTLDLQLEVADLEDTTTVTADMNFCAGWFPDADEDGYGATSGYQANCANTVSATFTDPLPANSNISVVQGVDYQGLDCLDEGTLVDDETLYGDLASVVSLDAVDVQDRVGWYIDYDNDGYGAIVGSRGDNGSGQFELLDGSGAVTDTIDIVYEDAIQDCVLTNPTVTLSTGETRSYLLNSDDCNDIVDFSDGVYTENPATGGLGASNQNPETIWYADIDGDGFAIGSSTNTSANFVYPDADFDCLCTSPSGACSSVVNNYQLVTGVTSSTCVKTGSLFAFKVKYQQCDSPTEAANTQGLAGLPISWTINNGAGFGDCDETNANVNEGAQEACDSLDIDEDCDGLADDNDNNGTVSGALTYFVDNDGDGSPTTVGKIFSCDGNVSSGASSLVYYYTLSNGNTTFADANVSGQCICPTDKCNESCRLVSDSSKSCFPTDDTAYTNGVSYCAGITSNGNFNLTKTPYDFTGSSFADFSVFVRDCNDNSTAVYPRAPESCDGVLNDCVNIADGVPTDEVDFDNDGYVECEFDGSTWNGSNVPLVGADCSPRDTNVYPNAPTICDGQYNNCDSWRPTHVDSARECFCYALDADDPTLCDTTTCVDFDGASCTPSFDSNNLQTCTLWSDVTERYADETGTCFCDDADNVGACDSDVCHTAEGAVCTPTDVNGDGQIACSVISFDNSMSPGAPANQVDNDGDCYVECFDGSTSFVGGTALLGDSCTGIIEGQDCNDTSSFVYPGAIEVCDGQFNNCDSPSYSATGAPVNETDDDEDGFVECDAGEYMDLNGCRCVSATNNGSGVLIYNECRNSRGQVCIPDATVAPVTWVTGTTGYSDCSDLNDTRYPGAPEICDGIFNDCDNPLLDPFVGASGAGCFCTDTTGSTCVDINGNSCSVDVNVVDLVSLAVPQDIDGSDYSFEEVECYCATSDCLIDVDGDGLTDCLDENEDPCLPADADADGFADTCIANPLTAGTGQTLSQVMYSLNQAPNREVDNDGDGYVECNYTASIWVGSAYVVGGEDCNDFPTDNGDRVYPTATEYCDGIFNDCANAAFSATTPPPSEADMDDDGFVECELTAGVAWVVDATNPLGAGAFYGDDFGCRCDGPCDDSNSICMDYAGSSCNPVISTCVVESGFGDCDDQDAWVFPGAPDLCDGQYNDCDSNNFSLVNVPLDESDADEDGFVECVEDGSIWRGDGGPPDGYGDCADNDPTTNGSADEICDGLFNDCAHPQKFPFEGVVSDCYCPSTDCMIDDGNGSTCVDSTGATCYPEDADGDNRADYCNESLTPVTIAGNDFYGVEVECYCPSDDCLLDTTGDGVTDCLTPTGDICSAPDDGNGYALTCAYGDQVPYLFRKANGAPLTAPMNETDHDGDGYVECEFFAETWEGPLSVDGGLDCNDNDDLVFPGATEYCDGQYNNCSDLTYDFDGAPATESDIDNDGYVECTLTAGVTWARDNVPVGDDDCNDNDSTVYPGAVEVCDGQFNNCSIFGYNVNGAPLDETDNDGDGYVECLDGGVVDGNGCACALGQDTNGDGVPDVFVDCATVTGAVCTPQLDSLITVTWAGNATPDGYGDCQDANAAQYPNADEACDGIFNNCEHPQKSAFEGVVSDCLCPTDDTNGDGTDDACLATGCLDTNGASCTPVDEDQNGYVDDAYCAISSTPENQTGFGFLGAEVDCYCPSADCQLDVLGNGASDCVTPEGATCIPSDSVAVGYADQCMTDSRGFTVSHTFVSSNGNALTRPFDETDNDGDGYVECEYISAAWLGSFSVIGGEDCDDSDEAVYPSALEVCDGQFNNCANNYVENSAPANEMDDDGDGWIECVRDLDVTWNAFDGSEEPNVMGYGTDGTVSGTSYCICSDASCSSNCMDEDGNTCVVPAGYCDSHVTYEYSDCDDADQYTHPFVALNEYDDAGDGVGVFSCVRDRDGDGYGDAAPTNPAVNAGHDCDDLNLYVHPKQNEICEVGDQVDSDCNGNVNTAVYSEGYILDTNGQGSLLYADADGDGFGDSDIAATPACEVAPGFVFNATDCNDEDSTINPNSKEICDGIDQDCDLTIDEADSLDVPSISKCTFMYRDVDADSYGDADYSACLCQEGSNPSVTYGEYEYVIYAGDCYDYNADIKPLSCADGIDQDDDGFVDDEDPNCIAGFKEGSDTVKEEAFELLDGHDNNCDGLVAAVELDCDDDGSYPLVPGESVGFNRSNKFQMAADIGLEACSGLSATLECWGEQQRLVCDTLTADINNGAIEYNGTGLWMLSINESDDGFGGRFDGGHREYPMGRQCGASRGDCDDQCAERCPDQTETCDGLDNDCSNTSPGTDGNAGDSFKGIPDAMISESPIAGTISDAEIDIDSDGYLSCDDFTSSGDQSQWSDASCDTISGVSEDNDCNNFCFFSSPNADERCDAFQGLCDGENLDGTDADADDMLTCGTWGTDETLTEDIYLVVWMKDVDWSQLASEEQELIRPVRSAEDIAMFLEEYDTADTGFEGDTGDTGIGLESRQETDRERLLEKRRQFMQERLPILNTNGGLIDGDVDPELLERMIPLVSPRALAPHCDSYLQDQLTLLLGFDNMEALRQMNDPIDQADILLQACDSSIEGVAGCGIVRLSLSRTTDEETYEFLDAIQSEILSFPTECEERTEEWISRSMWQRERIVEARTITVEWECRRMYGQACNEISARTRLLNGWESSMMSPERWLDVDRAWFKEIGRYNPESIDGGTMMSCWGDPTDATAKFNEEVGGDCSDTAPNAHRDNPEGPGDLVGLYLYGDMADCDTCLDGIDNNCDGAIDCADPACAPCFVGQGVGCGGGEDSPCSQGGCASPDQNGKERMYRSLGLIMMAMIISIIRRREKRSAS